MSGPERKPSAKPRPRAPRHDHPFRAVDDETPAAPAVEAESAPEAPVPAPTSSATAAPAYDPPVAIGGRGPQSVRTRLKVWCAGRNEPMDKVLVRAITEFLDRNGG